MRKLAASCWLLVLSFYLFVMDPNEVVYISNIPKQTSLAELHSFLRSSGNVVGSTFMRENRNDCRTKIAFVLFENEDQALEACNLDQTLFQSHRLSVLLSNDDRKFLAGFTIVIQNTSSGKFRFRRTAAFLFDPITQCVPSPLYPLRYAAQRRAKRICSKPAAGTEM